MIVPMLENKDKETKEHELLKNFALEFLTDWPKAVLENEFDCF
jgi:hypothetical protein